MKEKTRRILGWICLVYSGIHVFLNIHRIISPANPRVVGITREYHLLSIGLAIVVGALGLHLVRGKTETSTWIEFFFYSLLLVPLIFLRAAARMESLKLHSDWLPLICVVLSIFSIISIFIPFIFGDRILKWLKERPAITRATPLQLLLLNGMFWSLAPSMAGFFLYLLGSTNEIVYYGTGVSYVTIGCWWARWKYHYSKASNLA